MCMVLRWLDVPAVAAVVRVAINRVAREQYDTALFVREEVLS